MNAETEVKEPFVFRTRLQLFELMGLRAFNVKELLATIKTVPDSCIYRHTHMFLQQIEHYSPEPSNEFGFWVSDVLGEAELGEMLASIDIIQFENIKGLRDKIVSTIEKYIEENPSCGSINAKQGREFHFIKSVSFIMLTNSVAHSLNEFAEILEKVNVDSVYFHVFEARLRLGNKTNDFANWIENNMGNKDLAHKINMLDPYSYAIDDLRKAIICIIKGKTE